MSGTNKRTFFKELEEQAVADPYAPRQTRNRTTSTTMTTAPATKEVNDPATFATSSASDTAGEATTAAASPSTSSPVAVDATIKADKERLPSPARSDASSLSSPPSDMDVSAPVTRKAEPKKKPSVVQPSAPAEGSKKMPKKLTKDVILWGFVPVPNVGKELKKAWVEPPVLKTKYEVAPTSADFLPLQGNASAVDTTHNSNTTSQTFRYDAKDHFWGVEEQGGKGKKQIVKVEWDGELKWDVVD